MAAHHSFTTLALLALSAVANAAAVPLDPYADVRWRLELVDQAGLPDDASASTLRVRVGAKTKPWHGFSALVEGEAITRLGPEHFNDTVNGQTGYPVVADPSDLLLSDRRRSGGRRFRWTISAGSARSAGGRTTRRWTSRGPS
jgi:hypothetical protein